MNFNLLENMIGLDNFVSEKIVCVNENNIIISGHLKTKKEICPYCNSNYTIKKDCRYQFIKDINAFGKNVFIKLKKQRYICKNCSKTFYQKNNFLKKYQRMTDRLLFEIIKKSSTVSSFSSIARELNISISTLIRKFDLISYPKPEFNNLEVLSIDEFKGNTGGEKYNCILADPKNRIVLDILPKRYNTYLTTYFKNIKKEKRKEIKYFVSDMWKPYKEVCDVWFKNSDFIVDKYHWIRQVIWAFEKVRKEEQKKFYKTFRIYFKKSKRLLTKRFEFLSEEDKQAVNIMLYKSEKIRIAHGLKEEFLKILDCKNREEAKKRLSKWTLYAQNSKLSPFEKCASTMIKWSKGILNSFDTPYTNGFIEGCNNKIKVLKRNAYGYRNFERFRNRILHIFNYQNIYKVVKITTQELSIL